MTIGAHVVPVLIEAGPMPGIVRRDLLTRIQKEPPLTAPVARAAVPRYPQRLQTAARHRDEILLQRVDAERVADFVVMQRAVGTVGTHHELRSRAIEVRGDAAVVETRVIEVAEHSGIRSRLHRQLMMRSVPQRILVLVTLRALGGSNEFRAEWRRCRRRDRRTGRS